MQVGFSQNLGRVLTVYIAGYGGCLWAHLPRVYLDMVKLSQVLDTKGRGGVSGTISDGLHKPRISRSLLLPLLGQNLEMKVPVPGQLLLEA